MTADQQILAAVENDHQRFIAFQAKVAADLVFPGADQSKVQSRLAADQARLAADQAKLAADKAQ